jgi:hypothetical protein
MNHHNFELIFYLLCASNSLLQQEKERHIEKSEGTCSADWQPSACYYSGSADDPIVLNAVAADAVVAAAATTTTINTTPAAAFAAAKLQSCCCLFHQ